MVQFVWHRPQLEILRVVRQHVGEGGTLVAGPDCPEVYFLTGFSNPTRAMFDFLNPEPEDVVWMRALRDTHPIRVAVINTAPLFSPTFAADMKTLREQRFPAAWRIERFLVLYR